MEHRHESGESCVPKYFDKHVRSNWAFHAALMTFSSSIASEYRVNDFLWKFFSAGQVHNLNRLVIESISEKQNVKIALDVAI